MSGLQEVLCFQLQLVILLLRIFCMGGGGYPDLGVTPLFSITRPKHPLFQQLTSGDKRIESPPLPGKRSAWLVYRGRSCPRPLTVPFLISVTRPPAHQILVWAGRKFAKSSSVLRFATDHDPLSTGPL